MTLWNPVKCNSIITKTMGNSMSSTHTKFRLFFPQPTTQFACIGIHRDFGCNDIILCVFLHLLLLNSQLQSVFISKITFFQSVMYSVEFAYALSHMALN